jgi:archaemetzincin
MEALHIVRVGAGVPVSTLDELAAALAQRLEVSCHVRVGELDGEFAYSARRNQYWSTAILKQLSEQCPAGANILGVTDLDLFVPVLTFVFGEAQVGGRAALVSTRRLRNEFYGLPQDGRLMMDRLIKEAMHEVGHNFGLRHCHDWQCVMTSSHAVEKLDLKRDVFCDVCARIAVLV